MNEDKILVGIFNQMNEMSAVLEKREALLRRLLAALEHLPRASQFSILTSVLSLQDLEALVKFQEGRD